jgi:hypothetical protein
MSRSPPLLASLGDTDMVTPVISSNADACEVQRITIVFSSTIASMGMDLLIFQISRFLD